MCNPTIPPNLHQRRRSVDVGGLALALAVGGGGSGSGWGGWEDDEAPAGDAIYAELLSDMYTQTHTAVNNPQADFAETDISPTLREELIGALDSWHFEPHKLSPDAVLACSAIIFEALLRVDGMQEDVGVNLAQLQPFLHHLAQIYRWQNSYHNFAHALDVLQATHIFLCAAHITPPISILAAQSDKGTEQMWKRPTATEGAPPPLVASLSNADVFALYIAAIGHDVGHPGFTNVFMKNAKTPLSTVYDDKSALEQMHCALLLRVMRHHGLGTLLDRGASSVDGGGAGTGAFFRELLSQTVLATDMNVHFAFMGRFGALVNADAAAGKDEAETKQEGAELARRKVLLCQALIKCADISNPGRPPGVSRYWATALMNEWTHQAALEKHLSLPATVQPSQDPLVGAKSQVFFISTFAHPLFDLVARGIPQVTPYAQQCADNLADWHVRCAELTALPATEDDSLLSPVKAEHTDRAPADVAAVPGDFLGAFPLTLPPLLRTPGASPNPTVDSPASTHFPHHHLPGPISTPTRESEPSSPVSLSPVLPTAGLSSAAAVFVHTNPLPPPLPLPARAYTYGQHLYRSRSPSPVMPGAYVHTPPPVPARVLPPSTLASHVHAPPLLRMHTHPGQGAYIFGNASTGGPPSPTHSASSASASPPLGASVSSTGLRSRSGSGSPPSTALSTPTSASVPLLSPHSEYDSSLGLGLGLGSGTKSGYPTRQHLHHRTPSNASLASVTSAGSSSGGAGGSIAGSVTSIVAGPGANGRDAIRAAFRASVRKKKSFHRSSWAPGAPAPPPPPMVMRVPRAMDVVAGGADDA